MKRKQDDEAKGKAPPGSSQSARVALDEARLVETRAADTYERARQAVGKSALKAIAAAYLQLATKGTHIFGGVTNIAESIPDEGEPARSSDEYSGCADSALDAVGRSSEAAVSRYPGVFLQKKAEKRVTICPAALYARPDPAQTRLGKARTRFFQVESGAGSRGCSFTYYTDLQDGIPVGEKGRILLDRTTQIDASPPLRMRARRLCRSLSTHPMRWWQAKKKEILIRTPERKWVLVAKTPDEARWWARTLAQAATNLRVEGLAVPVEVAPSQIDSVAPTSAPAPPSVTVDGGAPPPAASTDLYRLVEAYKSEEGEGTLDLQVAEEVEVTEKSDDWWFLVVRTTCQTPLPKPASDAAPAGCERHRGLVPGRVP